MKQRHPATVDVRQFVIDERAVELEVQRWAPQQQDSRSRQMLVSFAQRGTCASRATSSGYLPTQRVQLSRPVVRRTGSTSEAVTDEEAQRFERIAAALVEKLKDLPESEDQPEGI